MRCLVDENLHDDIAEALRRRGHDVVYVLRSQWRRSLDEVLWDLAKAEEQILITQDLDFPLRNRGTIEGLVILRAGNVLSWPAIVSMFETFLDTEGLESVSGQVVVVRPGNIRRRLWSEL